MSDAAHACCISICISCKTRAAGTYNSNVCVNEIR